MKTQTYFWTAGILLAGCEAPHISPSENTMLPQEKWERKFKNTGQAFGDFSFLSGASPKGPSPSLWQGALKSLSAFPLEIADSQGGLLQTQWIILESSPEERFQIRVILAPGKAPQVEALQVDVVRQVKRKDQWILKPCSPFLAQEIKRKILLNTRAFYSSETKERPLTP